MTELEVWQKLNDEFKPSGPTHREDIMTDLETLLLAFGPALIMLIGVGMLLWI